MKRTLLAVLVAGGLAAGGAAKPPIDPPVQGKERTPVERDLHLPELPVAVESIPTLPPSRNPKPARLTGTAAGAVRAAVFQLGVVPLVVRPMW
jgi:hypothetical protein